MKCSRSNGPTKRTYSSHHTCTLDSYDEDGRYVQANVPPCRVIAQGTTIRRSLHDTPQRSSVSFVFQTSTTHATPPSLARPTANSSWTQRNAENFFPCHPAPRFGPREDTRKARSRRPRGDLSSYLSGIGCKMDNAKRVQTFYLARQRQRAPPHECARFRTPNKSRAAAALPQQQPTATTSPPVTDTETLNSKDGHNPQSFSLRRLQPPSPHRLSVFFLTTWATGKGTRRLVCFGFPPARTPCQLLWDAVVCCWPPARPKVSGKSAGRALHASVQPVELGDRSRKR